MKPDLTVLIVVCTCVLNPYCITIKNKQTEKKNKQTYISKHMKHLNRKDLSMNIPFIDLFRRYNFLAALFSWKTFFLALDEDFVVVVDKYSNIIFILLHSPLFLLVKALYFCSA